jgi:hypothetical protein
MSFFNWMLAKNKYVKIKLQNLDRRLLGLGQCIKICFLWRPCPDCILILWNYNPFKLRLWIYFSIKRSSLQRRYTIYHILLCSIYNIPRSFYYLLFGRRITSPFFCSLSKRWNNYTHQANMSALLFHFYSQMDCALLQTFYGWLFFCIWTITTLSGTSWIILSIMAACIQQLIAFWFVAINYRSSRYIWEFAAFLNVRKEGSA